MVRTSNPTPTEAFGPGPRGRSRPTLPDLPETEHGDAVRQAARPVAAWLSSAGGRQIIPVTARLATYALDRTLMTPDALPAAWYVVRGDHLLLELTARRSPAVLVCVARGLANARISLLGE